MKVTEKKTASRILMVSSARYDDWASLPIEELFELKPFSIQAILFNLHKMGWIERRAGLKQSLNPCKLAKLIDEFKPDIVYTYGSLVALNPLIARKIWCKHKSFKVVHGWDDRYGDIWRDVYGWLPGIFMKWIEKRIVTKSDAVVTLSIYQRAIAMDWGVVCKYIPNGCDYLEFDQSKCDIKLEGSLKVVYTGDQARWKRTSEICEAMRYVPKNIKLYLTGQHYPYLDKYASDNCIFLGYVSKNDQWCVVDQADVVVCTSDQDCNAKLHEYLRMKKPILGYNGRANMLFENGHNALLCRDYPAALQRLQDNPDLREKLASNATADIPVYTWQEITKQFDDYFEELLSV